MKTYGQLCAVARALDLIGDRWTLLIVRELLTQPDRRFGELERGLPGIATNLLAQRLRDLEDGGILTRGEDARTYRLTERGAALDGVVRELLRWGAPMVPDAPVEASFQMHWLSIPARHLLTDREPESPPCTIRFGTLDDGFDVTVAAGAVTVSPCASDAPVAATVQGPGPVLVELIQGAMPLSLAQARGVAVAGDATALARVLPGG